MELRRVGGHRASGDGLDNLPQHLVLSLESSHAVLQFSQLVLLVRFRLFERREVRLFPLSRLLRRHSVSQQSLQALPLLLISNRAQPRLIRLDTQRRVPRRHVRRPQARKRFHRARRRRFPTLRLGARRRPLRSARHPRVRRRRRRRRRRAIHPAVRDRPTTTDDWPKRRRRRKRAPPASLSQGHLPSERSQRPTTIEKK